MAATEIRRARYVGLAAAPEGRRLAMFLSVTRQGPRGAMRIVEQRDTGLRAAWPEAERLCADMNANLRSEVVG